MDQPQSNPDPREREIFLEALEQPAPEVRAALLDRACRGDSTLHRKVEAMLADHFLADGFMAAPAAGGAPAGTHPIEEVPGCLIGRYKLLEKIGEGGMGVVYMAEQEEPVRRRVALKIIKLGMDTRQVIARFEAERQALALMDHPNIAKVLDAGATETGRPFFVMELVRGIRITDYCDQNHLGLADRLKLFTQVCQAIQSAHQKGIIHRDIKPSNVLVTLNSGVPHPMVIDFGVAKATNQKLTEKTLFTNFGAMIGTPAYMSPEQAEMSKLDVDTRSDIYSLGVLLYELLAGTTPFPEKRLRSVGYGEMQRIIAEEEPERPSTRLTQQLVGDDVRSLTSKPRTKTPEEIRDSSRRLLQTKDLIHQLHGDLDWIVMKCLEKDRTRRYETANGLTADIQRHLNNEPVVARPPSRLYKLQKLARRNKGAFAAAGAVAAALVIGLGVSVWQAVEKNRAYHRAMSAEAAAKTEATKSRQVAELFKRMFGGMKHSVALGRDTTVLREIAEQTLAELDTKQKTPPEVDVELRACLATIFHFTGQYNKAEALHREVLPRMKTLLPAAHPDITASMRDLACVLQHLGKLDDAELLVRESVERSRKFEGPSNSALAGSLETLSIVLLAQNRLTQAEESAREALEMFRNVLGVDNRETAWSLSHHAVLLGKLGRHAEAEPLFRQALTTMRKLFPEVHPAVASVLKDYANDLFGQKKRQEASELYRQLLPIQRKLFGSEDDSVCVTLLNLSATLIDGGHPAEGEPFARECLSIRQKRHGPEHVLVAEAMNNVAAGCWNQGRVEEAERLFRDSLAMLRRLVPEDDPKLELARDNLERLLVEQQRFAESQEIFSDALKAAVNPKATTSLLQQRARLRARAGLWPEAASDLARAVQLRPDDHVLYHELAPLLVQSGDLAGYREHCQREVTQFRETEDPHVAERMAKDCLILSDSGVDLSAVAAWTELAVTAGKDSNDLPWFQSTRGLAEYRRGQFADAVEWARQALEHPGDNYRDLEATATVAMALHQLGQTDVARAALTQALELKGRLPKIASDGLGENWVDWFIARTLTDEAERLINNKLQPAQALQEKPPSAPEAHR